MALLRKALIMLLCKTYMLAILKEDVPHAEYEVWHFDEEKMYRVLISNPICQKVCEKQKYMNWQDLIRRFR